MPNNKKYARVKIGGSFEKAKLAGLPQGASLYATVLVSSDASGDIF